MFLGGKIGFNLSAQAHLGQGPGLPSSCNECYTGVRIHQLSLITEAEKGGGTPQHQALLVLFDEMSMPKIRHRVFPLIQEQPWRSAYTLNLIVAQSKKNMKLNLFLHKHLEYSLLDIYQLISAYGCVNCGCEILYQLARLCETLGFSFTNGCFYNNLLLSCVCKSVFQVRRAFVYMRIAANGIRWGPTLHLVVIKLPSESKFWCTFFDLLSCLFVSLIMIPV